jgi:hypothetical protein
MTLKAGLPDLVVSRFTPDAVEGGLCRVGESHYVRWRPTIRNRGPGLGAAHRRGERGGSPRIHKLAGRFRAGEAFRLDRLIDASVQVVVDPRKRMEEANEDNNGRWTVRSKDIRLQATLVVVELAGRYYNRLGAPELFSLRRSDSLWPRDLGTDRALVTSRDAGSDQRRASHPRRSGRVFCGQVWQIHA